MNKNKLLIGGIAAMSLVGLAGCQGSVEAPKKTAQEVVSESMKNYVAVKSYDYDMKLSGDVTGPADQGGMNVKFNASMKGGAEETADMKPKFTMKANVDVDAGKEGKVKGDGEIRMTDMTLYAIVNSVEGSGAMDVPDQAKSQIVGKWWKFPIPAEAFEQMMMSMKAADEGNMTPEQKQMKEMVESGKLFSDLKYVGSESVSGKPAYHYTAKLDKAAFYDLMALAAKSQGSEMTAADKAESMKKMENLNVDLDYFVDVASMLPTKFKANVAFKDSASSATAADVKMMMEATMSNFNQPIKVDVPANAQEVPLGAMGMGGAMAPESSMMDDSSMMMDSSVSPSSVDATVAP